MSKIAEEISEVLGVVILLLSFPAVLSMRAMGQVAAKRQWRMQPKTISRLMYFPFTPPRTDERGPTDRLPDMAVKVSLGAISFLVFICIAFIVGSIAIFWSSFSGPFAWGHMTYVGMGIVCFACGILLLAIIGRFICRGRVVLTLTPARLQFPSGSWIAWENIEDIALFPLSPRRESSPKRKGPSKGNGPSKDVEKHGSVADWAIEDNPLIWPGWPPKACGVRLVSYKPYLHTMSDRERKLNILAKRVLVAMFAVMAVGFLPGLSFSGNWGNVLVNDLGVVSNVLGEVPDGAELAQLASAKWQLLYWRKLYGFDMVWGAFGLDVSASDLARLMIEYKERRVVDRFLDLEDDPMMRGIYLNAALPRILNEDVLRVIAPFYEPNALFGRLRRLNFVAEQAGQLSYHEIARAAMLRLQRAQSPRQWRAKHTGLAHANAQWAMAADRAHRTWSNPHWFDHIREEMYHLLCAEPISNLSRALNSAVWAAMTSIVCARQWAIMLSDAGRDADRPELRYWGGHLESSIQGGDLTKYLTVLIDGGKLNTTALTMAFMKRGEYHYHARRDNNAFADFTRVIELSPNMANIVNTYLTQLSVAIGVSQT